MTDKVVVLVTCGTQRQASRIAKELVGRRLAACVNALEAPVRSTYRWKAKIETAVEYLLLIKTSRSKLRTLRAAVERLHSYELPEVIAVPIVESSATYLRWLGECLRPEAKTRRGGTQARRRKE